MSAEVGSKYQTEGDFGSIRLNMRWNNQISSLKFLKVPLFIIKQQI